MGIRAIAKELGISRNTVKKHLAADQPIVYPSRRPRPSAESSKMETLPPVLTESLVTKNFGRGPLVDFSVLTFEYSHIIFCVKEKHQFVNSGTQNLTKNYLTRY
jgi:hypothetical protein